MNYFAKINRQEIAKILPYSGRFMLLDACSLIEKSIHSIGSIDIIPDKWFFDGHFANFPVMPGVIIIEALAQTAALTVLYASEKLKGKPVYFVKINHTVFKKPVIPTQSKYTLFLESKLASQKRMFMTFDCKAYSKKTEGKVTVHTVASITATAGQ
ncbi:MAG: (3R)-hydroxymyristoyl-[acyl-carrier-] dehydratase domain protein [Candidatus Xenolissoclinum pacificiensis L6]|uniref:(3R)-hydroxymyristoyl-[acyl-carrier-] dehydratase domain protein n=1 Tax=Candidatus Xenolissoclinum pacificiensis L6 TaxID=1401685 RepID=W2UYV3_9RICK|nr:MAG: (3R)-hydroxymyristoyl-[acyl-carrier-] dehydratase domain protein [Candidatus Xenolissoclinum pacificiensis L6]